jgi:putative transposase
MKFRIIENQREMFPVRVLSDVMGVSAAGYYAWRGRPESSRKAANRVLLSEIRRLHLAHRGRYGAPRIHAALRGLGHTANTRSTLTTSRPLGVIRDDRRTGEEFLSLVHGA